MSDAIAFMEQVGRDASLRYIDSTQLDEVASNANVDAGEWAALKDKRLQFQAMQFVGVELHSADEESGSVDMQFGAEAAH